MIAVGKKRKKDVKGNALIARPPKGPGPAQTRIQNDGNMAEGNTGSRGEQGPEATISPGLHVSSKKMRSLVRAGVAPTKGEVYWNPRPRPKN